MKFLIILFMFFILGALFVISNDQINFSGNSEEKVFFDLYLDWVDGIFGNAKSVTGYAINMDWLP